MAAQLSTTASNAGLSVVTYVGDGSVLLAMNLDQHLLTDLAGFAIRRTGADGKSAWLPNRLTFAAQGNAGASQETTAETWTPSISAPFQKFRWIDFPDDVATNSTYTYEVSAMYFTNGGFPLRVAATVQVGVSFERRADTKFQVGFTRGYLSSQAYTDRFKNAPITPPGARTQVAFDTRPFAAQYAWLGYHGREMVFDFLTQALHGGKYLDAFVFDIDEPDVVDLLVQFGPRLRIIVDDHIDAGKHAIKYDRADTIARCTKSAGPDRVAQTMFNRFSHDKVFIAKDADAYTSASSVLCGSANFSIRGLYVQANSVVVVDDPPAAQRYADVFEIAFGAAQKAGDEGPPASRGRRVTAAWESYKAAAQWWPMSGDGMPQSQVSFAPHADPSTSLGVVHQRIAAAKKNIIFAVMQLAGSGDVMGDLVAAAKRTDIFTFGMVDKYADEKKILADAPANAEGAGSVQQIGGTNDGEFASYAYLHKMVPAPFQAEMSSTDGAFGQVIHHKFVVVDFNGAKPVVFSGSSNLAAGGEASNGDNLMMIEDAALATMYAVEGIRLVDHYSFRVAAANAKSAAPLFLQGPATGGTAPWYAPYYEEGSTKYNDRLTFFA